MHKRPKSQTHQRARSPIGEKTNEKRSRKKGQEGKRKPKKGEKKNNEKAEKIAEKDVAYPGLRQKPSINPREGGQRKEKAKEGLTKNVLTNSKGEPQVPQIQRQ